MFDAFWSWFFADTPGADALRQAGRILGESRRLTALSEAMAVVLCERANAGDQDAARKLRATMKDVAAMREELGQMEHRFVGLQAKAHAAGLRIRVMVPTFDPEALRFEAERELSLPEAEAEVDECLRT